MEPVFQRLGDVTIQRLEKPKEAKPEIRHTSSDTEKESEDDSINSKDLTSEEPQNGTKRNLEIPISTSKKVKYDSNVVSITSRLNDENILNNTSENEFSDYDTESEIESDGELLPFNEEIKERKTDSENEPLLDNVTQSESEVDIPATESNSADGEDYDFDIKEKLKEMGEISFETVKKGEPKPKKAETAIENEVIVTPARKPGEDESLGERKGGMLRRNIREVMDETKLDESTLAAQRQEMERLRRVNEQHRFLREVQKQIAQERMQNKVISLLQGNSSVVPKPGTSSTRIGNTVLVKLPNGQTKPMTKLTKRPFELVRIQKSIMGAPKSTRSLISVKKPTTGNLTPSVSIAPVTKKVLSSLSRPPSDTDSENDDEEEEERRPITKPKVRTPPVQTIDISSDDDCIVVSETEGDPHGDEPDEDPSNSGMHTNDEFNQPDEQGRVVVNIGHPDGEPDIYVAPQIGRIMKPHQIGGVRFLFDNLVESIGRFENSMGFGCILAHSMGLGKTLQIVCFSDVFFRHTSARTILCIMPINTLQNWLAEYNMWLPTEEAAAGSPLNAHGEVRPRTFNLHVLNDSHKTLTARAKVIHEWKEGGGVLLIGYEQYRLLSMRKHPKSRRKMNNVEPPPHDDDKNRALFDEVQEALVKPGPDLVICDEGHRIKNSHASISQALKQMRTKRRVVLTGYPLQNNLMEYWCMVDFVRPNYLGTKTEFCNMFERPIQNGQCIDSTEADIKLMRYRAHVLHSLLVGFVQRRSHTVLQTALPQKEEYVLLVRMTPFQRQLYETFMNEVVRSQSVPNPLKAFAVCCKIWNHPDVLYYFLKKRAGGEAVDIDLEEVSNSTTSTESPSKTKKGSTKKAGAKGRKPAASVTPYSSSAETTAQNSSGDHSNQSSNFGQSSFNDTNFLQNQNFQNYNAQSQLPYPWPPPDQNYNNPNDCYNSRTSYFASDTWMKKEDSKSWTGSGTSVKTETGDSKPKINIISDIKLGGAQLMPKITPEKKINILSDIKLEMKKEEMEEGVVIKKEEEAPSSAPSQDDEVKVVSDGIHQPVKSAFKDMKEDSGIPYDWAVDLLKEYVPGCIENSAKMEILFCIIRESIALGDRLLVFSQSLITLDLIEQFLQMNLVPGDSQNWAKNTNYYRLDGSTSALEREKLINEFNTNPKIHLFLVSTRAGSLGINLVGANRVVVLDASWNPCHDTQAVCRVYRYGQRKPCFVYRLVVDNCLEKKIYDRQINKQGMSDRVVDECNPDAHLTIKDVSTLCWDDNKEDGEERDWSHVRDNYNDVVLQKVLEGLGRRLNKEPFRHESLLVDRKDKQLSQQEKRLAKKGYEREKLAARQPPYNMAVVARGQRPVASVRPMQQGGERVSRWIPAEHWQRQGMTAQEMTLPLDVVIPTNQPDKGNIVLKAGQKVLVLKSPKGVYMQLESGKIVAIKTAIKVRGKAEDSADPSKAPLPPNILKGNNPLSVLPPPRRAVKPFTPGIAKLNMRSVRQPVPNLVSRIQSITKKLQMAKTKPYHVGSEISKSLAPSVRSGSGDDENSERQMISDLLSLEAEEYEERRRIDGTVQMQMRGRGRGFATVKSKTSSALEQLEQSTSAIMAESAQPFQETLDNITSSYQDEEKQDHHVEEHLHEDASSSDKSHYPESDQSVKTDIPTADYGGYNNYYNYNPYPPPPPPQGYPPQPYPPPPQHGPYDMGGYPPQQSQYNYGMYPPPPPPQGYAPQTYPPPAPPPPPQGTYDYGHPPQPVYGGYYPHQQYPQGMYPAPPPPPQGYHPPDYQYQAQNVASSVPPNTPYYQNS